MRQPAQANTIMKNVFAAYYPPTEERLAELWQDAVIVFDASALLNLYTYSDSTRNAILDLLESIKDRLWLPYQYALEFHRNRRKTIRGQQREYRSASKVVDEIRKSVSRLTPCCRDRYIRDEIHQKFEALVSEAKDGLDKRKDEHESLLKDDPHRERIAALFGNRVGGPPALDQQDERATEADKRYRLYIPPGYMDSKKPAKGVGHPYGDYFGWCEVLQHSKEKNRPAIVVTDERKPDWWLIDNDRKVVSPRPELISEFEAIVGKPFYLYTFDRFVQESHERLRKLPEDAVLEAKEREEFAPALVSDDLFLDDDLESDVPEAGGEDKRGATTSGGKPSQPKSKLKN
jgi:PIN like domain